MAKITIVIHYTPKLEHYDKDHNTESAAVAYDVEALRDGDMVTIDEFLSIADNVTITGDV